MPRVRRPDIRHQISDKVGFTLIEILVSLSVVGLLMALALPNLRRFNETQIFNTDIERLVSTVRVAQSNSQANIQPDSACVAGSSVAWRVIFKNNSDNYALQSVCLDSTLAISGIIEKSNINLSKPPIYTLPTGCASGTFILFTKNKIDFYCGGAPAAMNDFAINVRNSSMSLTKNVTINKGGSVHVQ